MRAVYCANWRIESEMGTGGMKSGNSAKDSVDTLNKAAMDITPFRNILNEMYSADVSMKIKSAYKVRFHQGKFTAFLFIYSQYRK